MPVCPLCHKFFPFESIGITNILEGEDAEEFWKNERVPLTKEQKANLKKCLRIYEDKKP